MKKIIYPSAALLTAFALLSVQTAKADTAQASDQANEPAATVEEVGGFSKRQKAPQKIREKCPKRRLQQIVQLSLLLLQR